MSTSAAAVLYSPVSVAELWAGARPSEYDALRNLFRALTCAPIDEEVGRQDLGKLASPIPFSEAGVTTRETKDLRDLPLVSLVLRLLRIPAWWVRRK